MRGGVDTAETKFLKNKNHIFPFMTTFYNFTPNIKFELSWVKMSMMLLCMFGLFIFE